MYSKAAWRKNPAYLSISSRYLDNGLDIVEEGSELVVRQSDGLTIGKLELDPNELNWNPDNALKVRGTFSGRYFDPDLAGGPIVRRDWQNAVINQDGLNDVRTHTNRFDDLEGTNELMITRLEEIVAGTRTPDGADLRYYTHELEELRRYRNLGHADDYVPSDPDVASALWENTHTATMETYSITDASSLFYSN